MANSLEQVRERTVVEGPDVEELVRVDAGDGAAGHVADVVHACGHARSRA